MGEVLEHCAMVGQMLVQHRLTIILVATPEDVMMGAGHHLDRVKLHEAQTLHHVIVYQTIFFFYRIGNGFV